MCSWNVWDWISGRHRWHEYCLLPQEDPWGAGVLRVGDRQVASQRVRNMKSRGFLSFVLCALIFQAGPVLGFSSEDSVAVSRTFDKLETSPGSQVTVTLSFTHSRGFDLRGFYYTDQVPSQLFVDTIDVRINGASISNYTFESGSAGDVYTNCIPYRWILETPPFFEENSPIPSNSSVEIVYSLSSSQEGVFNLDEFNWVGFYPEAPESGRSAFGHSDGVDRAILIFTNPVLPGDIDNNREVALADAILALQAMIRLQPATKIHKEADVNGDKKIGLQELVYILEICSGVRVIPE